jgi:virginiamycin B lyase
MRSPLPRKILLPAVAAVVALLAIAALPARAEHVTKFPVDGTPVEIVAGPDGALWFSDRATQSIVRITVGGAITRVSVGISTPMPYGVAVGPDGKIWFTEQKDNRVGVIDPHTLQVREFDLPTREANPTVITAGPDGNMWFVENLVHQIGRVTPDGVVTEFATPTPESYPKAIAAGSDGALWFVESEVNQIGRITVDGSFTEYVLPNHYSSPYRIISGPDGALYFTEYLGDRLGRITTSGVITEASTGEGSRPRGLTVGRDGAIYVAAGKDDHRSVLRFDASGAVSQILVPLQSDERSQPTHDFIPGKSGNLLALASGPDGNLWFTESDTGKVGRIELRRPLAVQVAPPR